MLLPVCLRDPAGELEQQVYYDHILLLEKYVREQISSVNTYEQFEKFVFDCHTIMVGEPHDMYVGFVPWDRNRYMMIPGNIRTRSFYLDYGGELVQAVSHDLASMCKTEPYELGRRYSPDLGIEHTSGGHIDQKGAWSLCPPEDISKYFKRMYDVFSDKGNPDRIPDLYQLAILCLPFPWVNNSIFMTWVNVMFESQGKDLLPHFHFDVLARMHPEYFRICFWQMHEQYGINPDKYAAGDPLTLAKVEQGHQRFLWEKNLVLNV